MALEMYKKKFEFIPRLGCNLVGEIVNTDETVWGKVVRYLRSNVRLKSRVLWGFQTPGASADPFRSSRHTLLIIPHRRGTVKESAHI